MSAPPGSSVVGPSGGQRGPSADLQEVDGRRFGRGLPEGDLDDERRHGVVLKALSPLRVCTWNSQVLLRSMLSRAGRINRKRVELERFLERSEVVLVQEAHDIEAGLELLPSSQRYFATLGDLGGEEASSLWGGVVLVVAAHLVRRALRVQVLQVGFEYHIGWVRSVGVHVDPSLPLVALRDAFARIRGCSQDRLKLVVLTGDFNLLGREDMRFQAEGGAGGMGDGVRVAEEAMSEMLELHHPNWANRRFKESRLNGASQVDRVYLSLSPAAFSIFMAPASVRGETFGRAFPSDHLLVMVFHLLAFVIVALRYDIQAGL